LLLAGCLLCAANGQVANGQSFERLPTVPARVSVARRLLQPIPTDEDPRVVEELPAAHPEGFPPLPPDPYESELPPLPPLDTELWNHGGSSLYVPEGDRWNWPEGEDAHYSLLRLPETWVEPKPVTLFAEFQGADPITVNPKLKWPGPNGYVWEPRFVGYGGLELFAFALEQDNRRQDVIGEQLLLELDLTLTGTERFHVQYRPLGRDNTGGSFYQFSNPEGFEKNTTGTPSRYWFEAELDSIFGAYLNPFKAFDYNIVAGKFPFALHNSLLIDDEFLGAVLSKNSLYIGNLSNVNIQAFYGFNDVDAFGPSNGRIYGTHLQVDHRKAFYEGSYVFAEHDFDSSRDSHFAAFSRTQFYGPLTVAARGLFKWGDTGGRGSGQLFVVESNYSRVFHENAFHVEQGVFYCNSFYQSRGWNSVSGGNLNRLRTAFETNPLVRIAAGGFSVENWGVACGVQLFRHHQDESFVPEIAFESPDDTPSVGLGLRYLRKTGSRSFFEVLGTFTLSNDPRFDREGVFTSYTILF
jgi:hypothetical protein